MSGIVAMLSRPGSLDRAALERATRALQHRGPDGNQIWIDDTMSAGLGHTRLAVVDIDGDRQPFASDDGSIHVVLDGDLHDGERVRQQLIARGHRFRTASAGELAVRLYQEHGACCVEHLRGEFALVLHDRQRNALLAVRDRLGVKPLVYAWHGATLLVASEAKALLAAGLAATWDSTAFLQSCALGGPLEDATLFAGIRRIPPGHLLRASGAHHKLVRYWDLDYPVASGRPPPSEAEHQAALAERLAEAVRLRLRADVPIACYLGGLDACTVFGLAQRETAGPLRTFTIGLEGAVSEETELARELAGRLGATYTPIAVRPADLPRDLETVAYVAERPIDSFAPVVFYQLAAAVREAGCKVVLTGEGSDEIFAGYAHYRRDLVLAAQRARAPGASSVAPAAAAVLDVPPPPLLAAVSAALGFVPTWLHALALAPARHGVAALLRAELSARLQHGEPFADLVSSLEVSRQLRGRHPVHQAMYLWSKSMLAGPILSTCNDAVQMAHGIQARMPYLDHRVVELSTQLPLERLFRGNLEKCVLREVARPVIGDAIYRRPKDRNGPLALPPGDAGSFHELLQDTLRSARCAMPLFDPARVRAALDAPPDRDPSRRAALDAALLAVLSACMLEQRFGIGDAI